MSSKNFIKTFAKVFFNGKKVNVIFKLSLNRSKYPIPDYDSFEFKFLSVCIICLLTMEHYGKPEPDWDQTLTIIRVNEDKKISERISGT